MNFSAQGKGKKEKEEDLCRDYMLQRDEYFKLCWSYNLPPRDLTLLLMGNLEIRPEDRLRLIQLVIALFKLENLLGPGILDDYLFTSHESYYSNSVIFPSELH